MKKKLRLSLRSFVLLFGAQLRVVVTVEPGRYPVTPLPCHIREIWLARARGTAAVSMYEEHVPVSMYEDLDILWLYAQMTDNVIVVLRAGQQNDKVI
jgi:hypothetical protein